MGSAHASFSLPKIVSAPSREKGHTLARLWAIAYLGDIERYFDELWHESLQSYSQSSKPFKPKRQQSGKANNKRVHQYDWMLPNPQTHKHELTTVERVDTALDDEFITARFNTTAVRHPCNRVFVPLKKKSFDEVMVSDEQHAIDAAVTQLGKELSKKSDKDLRCLAIYYAHPFSSQASAAMYLSIPKTRLERLVKFAVDSYFSVCTVAQLSKHLAK